MNREQIDVDVIVIGGGLAGLTAAHELSQSGRHVTILEKATHLGGRASSQVKGGFTFNLGPHALYRAGQAYRYLNAQGFALPGGTPNQQGSLALTKNETFLLPVALGSMVKTTSAPVAASRALAAASAPSLTRS